MQKKEPESLTAAMKDSALSPVSLRTDSCCVPRFKIRALR